METQELFFSNPNNLRVIQKFLNRLDKVITDDESFENQRNKLIKVVLNSIILNPRDWSTNCSLNVKWIGVHMIALLSETIDVLNKSDMDDLYSNCFRFINEFNLSVKGDLNPELEKARKFATLRLNEFGDDSKAQIEFALREMPIVILKSLLNEDSIVNLRNLKETAEETKRIHTEWTKELDAKIAQVNGLKNELEKYKTAFNFVGLYQGFDDMSSNKKIEKNILVVLLILFGIFIILPVLSEIVLIAYNFKEIDKLQRVLLYSVLPIISLVGILIYYFRILLFNYKSVKSQLLQLELRKTLCKFIQNYVDYSSAIKKKDIDSLNKFENIIFSVLVADDSNLPSTFDGLEQLAKLIKSVRSPNNV
jgi:hypothetical protein